MKFKQLFNEDMTPNWDSVLKIREFRQLEKTPQSKKWHGEGNVFEHTKLVTDEMYRFLMSDEKMNVHSMYYLIMMSAAICHDLGKGTTTVWDNEKNDYTTSNHGAEGARLTRNIFYEENTVIREAVVYMVRFHMDLHHIFDKEEETKNKFIRLSYGMIPINSMMILNMCDSYGSINDIQTREDTDRHIQRIREKCEEYGILKDTYKFVDNAHMYQHFYGKKDRSYEGRQTNGRMYVMIGLPGAGKDTWIRENLGDDVLTICRDDIRTEIGVQGEKPQGNQEQEALVTEIFNERLEEYAREGKTFVINNTNVRKRYRDDYHRRVLPYINDIVYVYVESPSLNTNKDRRKGQMSTKVIDKMLNNLEFPYPYEYNHIILALNQRDHETDGWN